MSRFYVRYTLDIWIEEITKINYNIHEKITNINKQHIKNY